MSFTKTISTIAALASIFGAGAAGFKLAETASSNQQPSVLEDKITQLEKQLEEASKKEPVVQVVQAAQQPTPAPVILPPVTPPPEVPENVSP